MYIFLFLLFPNIIFATHIKIYCLQMFITSWTVESREKPRSGACNRQTACSLTELCRVSMFQLNMFMWCMSGRCIYKPTQNVFLSPAHDIAFSLRLFPLVFQADGSWGISPPCVEETVPIHCKKKKKLGKLKILSQPAKADFWVFLNLFFRKFLNFLLYKLKTRSWEN